MQIPIEKEWVIAPKISIDTKQALSEYSEIVQQLLFNRGITTEEMAKEFIKKESSAYDPFLLSGMHRAVDRILEAVQKREKIAVFGDYDADGITSTALLTEVLEELGANVQPYLPEREEGYGVNTDAINTLHESEVSLIITVDCGIRSPMELNFAQDLGMTVIITDHHMPGEILPKVHAIICPRVENDKYPEKNLSGVGVAYKLAQALFDKAKGDIRFADEWLDLVAIGTVADVVPLLGENRLLVSKGIQAIRFSKRTGLKSLMNVAGLKKNSINTFDVSFGIAPRINAAGRLESPQIALNLLRTKSEFEAGYLSQELDDINRKRQRITQEMHVLAQKEIDEDRILLSIIHEDFTSGLVGLVSAKLTEFYYRPSIVGFKGEEFTRASCRSIPEFHITKALDKCEHLLIRHGGHAMAAGFTVANEHVDELLEEMEKIARDEIDLESLKPKITVDLEYPLHLLPENILEELDQLEPLGAMNSEAVFLSRNVEVKHAKMVGKDENHLKLWLKDGKVTYDGIAFHQGYWGKALPKTIDIVYAVERNHFNGKIYKQLRIKDLKPSN